VLDGPRIDDLAHAASHLCAAHDGLVAAGFEWLAAHLAALLAAIDIELTEFGGGAQRGVAHRWSPDGTDLRIDIGQDLQGA
jgi:hypothetical protein